MKKLNFGFVIFLILAMLVVPIFTFVSCDNGTTPQGSENPNTPQVPENPDTPPVDSDGEDGKEDDKTQDEEQDEVINHLVGEWIMDELFITCKINEDKSFETIVEIDEDTTQNYEGSYVLGKDGKSATATVNNVPTGNGETITATVTMEMLEGESDVFSMDLTAFDLGDACTFVKKQSTTPNFVGTWSNEWWDILIDETNYAVIGRESVGEYAGVITSKGEIAIFANTITLTQTEFPEMLIATGVMSTNGKSYVNYYHQTSSAPGTWESDVFTRTSTEIPEIEIENTGNQEQSWNSTFFIGDWLQNTHETTITINDNGTFSLVSSIDSFNGLTGTYENYIEDDSSRCSRVSFNGLDGTYILTMIEEDVFEIALPDAMGGTCTFVKKRTENIDVKGRWECESFNYPIEMQDSTFTVYIGDTENILMEGDYELSGNSYVLPGTYTTKGVVSLSNKAYVYVSGMGEYIYTKVIE
ncbi:MAG: hypothetical protein IJD23_06895 [Spirochaetaceae bacterium]|nr:hypothetical protein [Spirochaetaceae bacterium]